MKKITIKKVARNFHARSMAIGEKSVVRLFWQFHQFREPLIAEVNDEWDASLKIHF